ncbi:unnamed protein product [Penicillium nalgiovense]|nr:unnamed protein product [Penicillium nalgiovense]
MWFSGVNFTENTAADCWNQAWLWNASDEEIILWNPSLASNETSSSSAVSAPVTTTSQAEFTRYPCTMAPSSSYCVQLATPTSSKNGTAVKTPVPRANGEIANCTDWYASQSKYDTCYSVITGRHLLFDEFYAMNPSVKSDCSGLSIGTYYCISTYEGGFPPGFPGWVSSSSSPISSIPLTTSTPTGNGVSTPSPIQTGMVSTCNQFYKVVADDGCYDIANEHGIPLASFYAWNPAVKTDCSGLQADEYVCVGVKLTSTSAVVTATTSVSGVTTPSPIQKGMVSTCDTFYDVHPGDSCYDIADTHGVSLDTFYTWNPAVKTDCSGLQPDEYVCVGVKAATGTGVTTPYPVQTGMVATCDAFYKVIADDSCVDIANANGVPVASFYAWNPAVKTDCSGLQVSEYVCVGISST